MKNARLRHISAWLCVATAIILVHPEPRSARAGEPNGQEDDLTALSFAELMDMEISSVSKKEEKLFTTPASAYVLTSEDIRRSGHQSIPEVLRMVPGIQVAKLDANKWAITARGFNGVYAGKLLVLIDGRSVYTPLYSGVYWDVQDLMLEDIERIEVVKGPGGTLWGANAVNGIINIITKSAKDTQGNLLTAGAGTEERGFTSVRHGGKLGENAYYRVYAKYFNRDEGVYANGDQANDASDTLREGFRIDWDTSAQDLLTLQGDFYDGHSGQTVPMTAPLPLGNHQRDGNTDVRGLNLLTRWTHTYSDTSDMSLQFYYDRTERYGIQLGESRDTFDVDFQHRFQVLEGHNLIWGLGYRHTGDNIDNSYTVSFNPPRSNDELWSAFAQDEITLVEDLLKFTIGTKLEENDYTGTELQPSARLLWTPNERNTLWTAWTRSVSTPPRSFDGIRIIFNSFPSMSNNGNRGLKAQDGESYEMGYRVKPCDSLFLDFSAFYTEYDDLYSKENLTMFSWTWGNKLRGSTYGGELAAHWQVNERWKINSGYSFLKVDLRTKDGSADSASAPRIERSSPQNTLYLNSQLSLQDNLEFDASLYYVDNVSHHNIPSYTRLDVGLTWQVNDHVDLALVGQNLLDGVHPEFDGPAYIASEVQRGIFGKLTWRF